MQSALSTGSVLDVLSRELGSVLDTLNSELDSDLEVILKQSKHNFDVDMEHNASETPSDSGPRTDSKHQNEF